MKFLKKKIDGETTLRKVVNDDRTKVYGVVGTVDDLLKTGVLEWCEYDHRLWLFIAGAGTGLKDCFGKTREEVTAQIKE